MKNKMDIRVYIEANRLRMILRLDVPHLLTLKDDILAKFYELKLPCGLPA